MSRISRRSLLTSGAAAGVLAASGMALAATPRSGGVLRAGLAGGSINDNWDSRTFDGFFMVAAGHGVVFDCLTEIGADGALRGELAESWEASSDACKWTVNLRRGVQFHNGKSFVAEDVLESFSLHQGNARSPAAPLLAAVTEIRALTPHQIQFQLNAPNADFPYLLADYHLVIYPAGLVELAMVQGVGTGLYKLESFEPGDRLRANRVGSHYKDGVSGHFDEIELVVQNDDGLRLSALEMGQIDVASHVSGHAARAFSDNRKVTLQSVAGNQHVSFALDRRVSPYDRADLRSALKFGVDRNLVVKDVLGGFGRVGNDSPIGPSNQYYSANLASTPYDPDRAAYHLRKAGVQNVALSVGSAEQAQTKAVTQHFQKQMRDIGLHVQLQGHENSQPSAFSAQASAGRATEDWMLSTYYASNALWANSDLGASGVDKMLLAARSELDSTRRQALYEDIQIVLRDSGAVIIPAFSDHLQAVSKAVGTPSTIGKHWAMDNARFAERWWRA